MAAIDLRALIQRREGFLFVPLLYRFAARLEQLSWEEFTEDPGSATYALRAAQRLFQLPAIVTHYRLGAEAEACGADLGRDDRGEWTQPITLADGAAFGASALGTAPLRELLDVTRRLSDELKGQVATIGVLTGPRTLNSLCGEPPSALGEFYAVLARAYAERGVHLLLVAEDQRAPAPTAGDADGLAPLINVARYFRLPTALLDSRSALRAAPNFDLTLGGAGGPILPVDALSGAAVDAKRWRQKGTPLLLTDTELPPDVPAEQLSELVRVLAPG